MTDFIRSLDELVELIHTWGFVPFFKNSIPGFSLEELTDMALNQVKERVPVPEN